MSTALLLPAAGSGTRLGAGIPKAFVLLAGRSLLARAVEGAVRSGVVDAIVVAAPAHLLDEARRIAEDAVARSLPGTESAPRPGTSAVSSPVDLGSSSRPDSALTFRAVSVTVVAGGDDRVASVSAALDAVPEAETVLVHDAARCLTPAAVFRRVHEALVHGAHAVVPVLPVTDTVRSLDADGVLHGGLDRSALRRVQTPQGFDRTTLIAAHAAHPGDPDPALTDDAGLAERIGTPVVAVDGDEAALKITHPLDLRIAQLLLEDVDPDELNADETGADDLRANPTTADVPTLEDT